MQPELNGPMLYLRPLHAGDFEQQYAAASDPAIWAGHPVKDRYKLEVFRGYFDAQLASAAALAVIDRSTGRIIGGSRYYVAPDQPQHVSIGFTFINNAYWGGGTNYELKSLMLDHAFQHFSQVWFHIDPSNLRSQKGTAKLGAQLRYQTLLDLSGGAKQWLCYCLEREAWIANRNERLST
jgi:RimJ/RimL family protein N-acetyltransferase